MCAFSVLTAISRLSSQKRSFRFILLSGFLTNACPQVSSHTKCRKALRICTLIMQFVLSSSSEPPRELSFLEKEKSNCAGMSKDKEWGPEKNKNVRSHAIKSRRNWKVNVKMVL